MDDVDLASEAIASENQIEAQGSEQSDSVPRVAGGPATAWRAGRKGRSQPGTEGTPLAPPRNTGPTMEVAARTDQGHSAPGNTAVIPQS